MSGRRATTDIRPGDLALSVGAPSNHAPPGWTWVPLDRVATLATGHTPSRKHSEYWGGDVPWMSVTDARPHDGGTIHDTAEHTNPLGIKNSAAVVLPENTVCLSRTGSIGYSVVLGRPMATSQGFVNWICSPELNPRFLQLLFVAERPFLERISEGVAHTTIYFPEVKAFHICVPARAEQDRIVAALEEYLSDVEAAVAGLERARRNAVRFEASLLDAAMAGANDTTGQWKKVSVGDIAQIVTGTTPPTADLGNYGGDLPFFKPTDLNAGYEVRDAREHLSTAGARYARRLPAGSVLVTCIGATIGKTGLARVECATNQQINAAIVDMGRVTPEWLFWFFRSPHGQAAIKERASATTLPIINKSKFSLLNVPLPPLEEQRKLVAEIERSLSVAHSTVAELAAQLARAVRLRQAILKRAFAGKLIPQESRDEPANALLVRLRSTPSPTTDLAQRARGGRTRASTNRRRA